MLWIKYEKIKKKKKLVILKKSCVSSTTNSFCIDFQSQNWAVKEKSKDTFVLLQ